MDYTPAPNFDNMINSLIAVKKREVTRIVRNQNVGEVTRIEVTGMLREHLTKIVDAADPDLEARMPSSNVNLHKFLDRAADFGVEEARCLVEEAKILWPTLSLDAPNVLALRKGLRGSKESILPYKRLSAFFALGSKRLNARAAEWKQEDILPTIVHGIIADIAVVLAQDSEPTSSSPEHTPSM
ncbi:hypothetical protein HO133_004257 [Letharia lupina]|uniref:Uncharacterized protein n=1 Tax=Letharia lupina TaxID=560253 RepID=A0A8H6KZG1_9LECA|nr:uncharacterized protein HO133_004257 [Letharia lupina]KAF6229920.1 hypothetical protein HO133_004257 [Letharia lupina]